MTGERNAGAMMLQWTVRCARLVFVPPYSWVPEAFAQASIAFRRVMLPLIISSFVFSMSYGLIMTGQFLIELGVSDRWGSAVTLGYVREFTWVALMVLAGVVGSAVTADLGARRIREELDALDVLGVDTVRYLVLPRVVGIAFAGMVVQWITLIFGEFVMNFTIVPARYGTPVPVIIDAMRHSLTSIDLISMELKDLAIGIFIAIVACERGLTCRRGAEGVGRAVNQCVVLTFFGIWFINSVWNTAYLSLFPSATGLRG
jgi:phospholipid/cholesterol/gamma-HCH transport system permease protein